MIKCAKCGFGHKTVDDYRACLGVMNYEVVRDEKFPNEWRCEAINAKTGDIYVAVFSGPDAEVRAREYARSQ